MNLIKLLKQKQKVQLQLQTEIYLLNEKINNFSDGFWYAVVDDNNYYEIFKNEVVAKAEYDKCTKLDYLTTVDIISNNPKYSFMEHESDFEKYIEKLDLIQTKTNYPDHWTSTHQNLLDQLDNIITPAKIT